MAKLTKELVSCLIVTRKLSHNGTVGARMTTQQNINSPSATYPATEARFKNPQLNPAQMGSLSMLR